ncbi:membrane-bound lytic murein transglycosylase D [Fodinibius roseus]|uniref:Membrane-bound lytic murein transglycosylase D n=1 Tax=Fodinibius roseus TaxID=1194090 RepID=A0A1M4WBT2_9BACT|nr:LysM peptidoglycan-binding domain-containing protein [Fodinibius roseus]SHE78422.1 membrane-bound lytic murein transglycosylase D [Fodinibius roseus]
MQQTLYSALILSLAISFSATAQQSQPTDAIELREVPTSPMLLPYNNPLEDEQEEEEQAGTDRSSFSGSMESSGDFRKDTMQRITEIYRIHVKAMEAQMNENPLQAEKHITDALYGLQELLDTYPELQTEQRFSELYRSIMTEYRKFYGIKESEMQAEGEIFAIQEELFSDSDEWMKESFSVPENLPAPSTSVPLVQNEKVNRSLMYFSMKRPEVMEKWLKRSEKYFPMMKEIFEEENVPTELIHLSMVESGLNPRAQSWASAVGMWQFIRGTGSVYGLDVTFWKDERRDPEKATRAAARHLRDLYEVWGDWHLALAGYNISPRGLKYAIRRGGGEKNYWEAWPHLPSETRNYVPSYIAATLIGMEPESFGFDKKYEEDPYSYDVYQVAPLMSLESLAEAAGITLEELKEYNPELLRWATPPGGKYPLKLPAGLKDTFAENYEDIPKDERGSNVAMHTVSSGESLGIIARKYGTSVQALYETNEGLSSTIHPGQKVVVPIPGGSAKEGSDEIASGRPADKSKASQASASEPSPESSSGKTEARTEKKPSGPVITYEVRKGDTIGHIAEWFDVTASKIRTWNNLTAYIRPGDRLEVHVEQSKKSYYQKISQMPFDEKQEIELKQRRNEDITLASLMGTDGEYTVQPNDTLIDIANKHGVSVDKLRELNGLSGSRIQVGETLIINSSE